MGEQESMGFEGLECYQLALQVLREAYRVAGQLPPEEKNNLADQMRRAALSAVLNIAEGYGRYHYLDSLRFYYTARGSLEEVLSGFIACAELGYTSGELPRQRELCHSALRSLNGYIRYVRKQQQGQQEYGAHLALHEPALFYTTSGAPLDDLDPNLQSTDSHSPDPQSTNSQPTNSQSTNSQSTNSQSTNSQSTNLPTKESHGQLAIHPNRN